MVYLEKEYDTLTEEFFFTEGLCCNYDLDFLALEAASATSNLTKEVLYPKIHTALSNPTTHRKFQNTIKLFIDRNSKKLLTSGPMYMIPFGDKDKADFYEILGITEIEVVNMVNTIIKTIKGSGTTDFKLLRGNPIFWVFYCCIRHYTIVKDTPGLNATLAIYALSVYPSVFNKYFKYEVSSPGTMQYTIDALTNKFIIKNTKHIFGALTYSIQNSYKFLKESIIDGSDAEAIRFIQRIRNDQNSMIKKICDQYNKNLAAGLSINDTKENFEDNPFVDDIENNTTIVENISRKIVTGILTNGIDLKRCELCAKLAEVNFADCRFYLSKIIISKNEKDISAFIQAIVFLFIYTDRHRREEINSSMFIPWSVETFRKTNSNDANINTIKRLLDEWGESSGVHAKFKRDGSRINYKKSIYFYFILSIMYYNQF